MMRQQDLGPIVVRGPALAVATCARRLAPLGARPLDGAAMSPDTDELTLGWGPEAGAGWGPEAGAGWGHEAGQDGPPIEVDLSWYGPAPLAGRPGEEAVVQALCGLMAVHGRDRGGPRRIGLEVASVAAGILAAHAVVAALVGRGRGNVVRGVQTSVLQAGLLLVSHRVAADSSGAEWVPAPPGPAPGPPFRSADGRWFEIETLDPLAWKAFWERLGAGDADLGGAWRLFRPRYFRGTCTLPPGLHEATAARTLAEIAATATDCAVSLCPVRDHDEVLAGTWQDHPTTEPFRGPAPQRRADVLPGPRAGLPLAGLRVVSATNRMQGPLAGLLLQMLGAEVIRVEPPGGDLIRTVPPLLDGTGSFFLSFNRGKRAVELDLSNPAGRGELADLVAGADVFLQNWRPGKAAEWGLDADGLATVNPHLVYAQASGWGQRADLAHLLGTDFLVQAYAGVAAAISPHDEEPLPSRALLTDYTGALLTCEAVLAGLFLRERTGRGQRVEASLLAGAMALQAHVLQALATGQEKGRRGGRPVWGPLDRPLPTADGVLVVSVQDDHDLHRMCEACHVDPGQGPRAGIESLLAERIAGDSAQRWERTLSAAGVACAVACTDLGALPADPRLAGLLEPLAAAASVPASPWRLRP